MSDALLLAAAAAPARRGYDSVGAVVQNFPCRADHLLTTLGVHEPLGANAADPMARAVLRSLCATGSMRSIEQADALAYSRTGAGRARAAPQMHALRGERRRVAALALSAGALNESDRRILRDLVCTRPKAAR